MTAVERFLHYVTYWTTSDPNSTATPSTERQKDFGQMLLRELQDLGVRNVTMDAAGNVMGTIPGNRDDAPTIALIAHMDTSPDAPGLNVKPRIVLCTGEPLELCPGVVLSEQTCPGWQQLKGQELIVTDGTTLLGADDKAGVAEIMTLAEKLVYSNYLHGEVRVVFTTDEEVGRGTEGLSLVKLNSDFAFTVDGGPLGQIEYENFNGADGDVVVHGVSVHPGSAKGILVNASTVAMEFHSLLPADAVPEKTEGYEGFFHLCSMEGDCADARLHYIIRDHDEDLFAEKKQLFLDAAKTINDRYGAGTVEVSVQDRYYNMKEEIEPHMHLIYRAQGAFARNDITPVCVPVRGGTDGAALSRAGLPCPNLSTGGYLFHSVREFIPVKSLDAMVQVLEELLGDFIL